MGPFWECFGTILARPGYRGHPTQKVDFLRARYQDATWSGHATTAAGQAAATPSGTRRGWDSEMEKNERTPSNDLKKVGQ